MLNLSFFQIKMNMSGRNNQHKKFTMAKNAHSKTCHSLKIGEIHF